MNTSQFQVINESYMHNVPKGSETHFKVVVVSGKFEEVRSTVPGVQLVHVCLINGRQDRVLLKSDTLM